MPWLQSALSAALSLFAMPLPSGLESAPPYKVDGVWSFFVNQGHCSAGIVQPSNDAIMIMAFDAGENAFTVGFTERRKSIAAEPERLMGIRLHRPGGVLDDGWEDIAFSGVDWPGDQIMWVSQPLSDPALHDFSDFESLVFIDHGRTAGTFRGKNNQVAVRELRRCAKEQRTKQ